MKTRIIKGWIAPGVTEARDARYLAEDIKSQCLYERKDDCLRNDCHGDEQPIPVTITIEVDHRKGQE